MRDDLSRTFGYDEVSARERRARIAEVFDGVAPRYDLMNDLMSMGVHRLWKRAMVGFCDRFEGERIVDLAGGTGDIARLLAQRRNCPVIVADASLAMMLAGRRTDDHMLGWVAAEGEAMPFADNSLDLITISFGLRNMTSPLKALEEARRCLRPGGALVCLEFSRPHSWFAPFYDIYSFAVIPLLGALIARRRCAYQYLVESIRRFPGQKDLEKLLRRAGFGRVGYRNFLFGVACLHWGVKT